MKREDRPRAAAELGTRADAAFRKTPAALPEGPGSEAELRLRAEVACLRAELSLGPRPGKSPEDRLRPSEIGEGALLHELRVHQIELEMQNETLRQAQADVAHLQERYFDLYNLAPIGYLTLDGDWRIVQANLFASSMFGKHRGDLRGTLVSKLIVRDDQDALYHLRQRTLDGSGPHSVELRLVRENGAFFWGSLVASAAAVEADSMVRLVLNDISDRKRAEIEAAEARAQEAEASRVKIDFLSRISHELRTPLNAILGFAQLLDGADDAQPIGQRREDIRNILRSGRHLALTVEDLISLSALGAKSMVVAIEPVDVAECLNGCVEVMSNLVLERGLALTQNGAAWTGLKVLADPFRLRQVLLNLLANAIKYNREGGTISVSGSRGKGRLRISVADTGLGIKQTDLPRLFQPFTRLNEASESQRGSGVGLSLIKQFTELMGGSVGVESDYGGGSTFWIELPIAEPGDHLDLAARGESPVASQARDFSSDQGAGPKEYQEYFEVQQRRAGGRDPLPTGPDFHHGLLAVAAPPPPSKNASSAPPDRGASAPISYARFSAVVLVVDDTPINALVLRRLCERLGCEVDVASDGQEAINLTAAKHYDLVLMDRHMPVMDGIEGTRQIRGRERATDRPRLAIVALTADALPEDEARSLAAGMDAHATKPIGLSRLEGLLLRFCPERLVAEPPGPADPSGSRGRNRTRQA